MKEGRLYGQFWSVYVSCKTNFKDAVDWGLQQLDITREYVDMYPEFELVNDKGVCNLYSCALDLHVVPYSTACVHEVIYSLFNINIKCYKHVDLT